jgi:beta propeller repeat protein
MHLTQKHSSFTTAGPAGRLWWRGLRGLALFLMLGWNVAAFGQEQFQGVCAQVKIVIQQKLTLERIGFDARLEISNNDGSDPITDFSAALTFENPPLSTNGTVNDASSLFFVRAPTFENINSVSGDGVIAPTTKAVIHWFIIPKPSAGGITPDGIRYLVGCRLAGKLRGVVIPTTVMSAFPASIYVRPDAQLQITYFQPRDVQGDDPFTPQVESPVPFTLGVLVKNVGYGTAQSVNINSQQPKIVASNNGLLLVAQLLGARVADQAVLPTSLNVNLGDIPPGQARKGAWDMITTLSGQFIQFSASYTHASDLGGQETSLIQSLNAYFITHEVLDDDPGRDLQKDFLTDINTNDTEAIPTALYESEGNILPVNLLTNVMVVGSAGPGGSFQVTLNADKPGWGFLRVPDPGQDQLAVASVVRSDGKILNTNNFWTNHRYTEAGNVRQNWLNLFDKVDLNNYSYAVTYAATAADTTPPVLTMRFAGPMTTSGGNNYVTPDTQIYFTAVDASPVSMFYNVTNGPFQSALPFSLTTPGSYPIAFYATDSYNNRSVNQTNLVVVSGNGGLDFAAVGAPNKPMFVSGDALSVRPFNAPFTFQAAPDSSQVDAQIDIFQGVVGWVTVSNVPSSPTTSTTASLNIGGDFVDDYKYSVNGGVWSAELPVATPINLSGLNAGNYAVSVLGHSQYGGYLDASNAVTVNWVVSPTAPPASITGTPATPTLATTASLNIGGSGVSAYHWTINNGYYRPESNAPGTLVIPITSSTGQAFTVSVLGKTNGVYQATNTPTSVAWSYDPMFGYPQPGMTRVRSVTLTNVGTATQSFAWDGRNDAGMAQALGWYTVRIRLADQLSRTNFVTRLVQIGNLAGPLAVLSGSVRGPKNPNARGHWAVWQDQSDGNWQIYAQDVTAASSTILQLSHTALSQENSRTDGRYVVWQGRQADGDWDIYLTDLSNAIAPQAITSTPATDEVNPTIDWPWVVYQTRPTANPSAAWNLMARNLVTAQTMVVSPSAQDELDPDVQAGRVVWQDWRDVGPGEIYFKNLESGEERRITTNTFGQYHPVIYNNWIAWQDNRNGEVDIYGFDLLRNTELAITHTTENETRPFLDGPWLLCQEDSLGALTANVRLIHMPSLNAVPITRTATIKDRPAMAGGKVVWLDTQNNQASVVVADLPSLQGVFQNRNCVAITAATTNYFADAFSLLTAWHTQVGVQEMTYYSVLVPQIVSATAYWTNGAPAGQNFALTADSFLWIKFANARVLDLGINSPGPLNLPSGVSVFSYAGFPSGYTAFQFLNQLGVSNGRAVRMLDAEAGCWRVAEIQNGRPVGDDFPIPRVAVLMLDLANPVNPFTPQ